MTSPKSQFTTYIDDQLEQRGWNLTDLAEHTGLASSVIFRYRRGYRPTIDNARTIASTLEVPLLDVLVASGVLTQAEAHHSLSEADQQTVLSTVSTVDLAREQLARAERYEQVKHDYNAQQIDLDRVTATLEELRKRAKLRLNPNRSSLYLKTHHVEDAPEEFTDELEDPEGLTDELEVEFTETERSR